MLEGRIGLNCMLLLIFAFVFWARFCSCDCSMLTGDLAEHLKNIKEAESSTFKSKPNLRDADMLGAMLS